MEVEPARCRVTGGSGVTVAPHPARITDKTADKITNRQDQLFILFTEPVLLPDR